MTSQRHHYFFKIGIGNFIFDYFLRNKITPHLIIGHGNWKLEDYNDSKDYLQDEYARGNKLQIEAFFNSVKNKANSYFWIFYEEKIYVLKAISEICDIADYHELNDYCEKIEK